MKESLPFFSSNDASSEQGLFSFFLCQSDKCFSFVVASHLCDTKGCISENHLVVETRQENISRQNCFGAIIQMYEKSSGNYCITQVKPCKHGRKLKTNSQQQLEHGCHKICTSIAADQYIQSFK